MCTSMKSDLFKRAVTLIVRHREMLTKAKVEFARPPVLHSSTEEKQLLSERVARSVLVSEETIRVAVEDTPNLVRRREGDHHKCCQKAD